WAGDVISSKDKSAVADEFLDLQKDIELRKEGATKLHTAAEAYHHILSKKQFNEALGDSDKLLPIDALGIVMIVHGEQFPDDSDFGSSLVKLGRAHCKAATLQEAYALTFKDTFITAIEKFKEEIKEYEALRKKAESRKQTLESATSRFERLRGSKKDKDRQEAEEELERAQQRYDETSEDLRAHIHAIQEHEITQQRELTHFLELEINYVQQYLDVLHEVRDEWPDRNATVKRHSRRRSSAAPSRSRPIVQSTPVSQAVSSAVADSSDEEAATRDKGSSRFIKHRKSNSTGSRTPSRPSSRPPSRPPSRPSSRLSRKRANSTANALGSEKDSQIETEIEKEKETEGDKDKEGRPRRFSVAGWASTAVESISSMGSNKSKDKEAFTSFDNDATAAPTPEVEPPPPIKKSNSFSLTRRLSRKKQSQEDIHTTSPKVTPRILKPPSLQDTKVVWALQDFAGSVDELSFKTGVEIKVLNEVVDGWWMGEIDGKKGLFPTAYVSTMPLRPSMPNRPSRNGATTLPTITSPDAFQIDNGYATSDMEDLTTYTPLAHSRSPLNPNFNDIASITDQEEDSSPFPLFPTRPRRFSDDMFMEELKPKTTPRMRTMLLSADVEGINKPLISRSVSEDPSNISPTKRAPPPPPPRRTQVPAHGTSPAVPERKLGPALPARPSVVYNGSNTTNSAAELSNVGCGQFRQNPFQPQGVPPLTATKMANTMKKRKIAVLGSRSVGKSSLVKQFIENHFVDSYYPTIESTFARSVVYNGIEYDCQIIDTAGQDEYSPINPQYAIGIHGYVLVYSIATRNSFDMIQIVYDKIVDFCGVTDIPCVIVGAKVDLAPKHRLVQTTEGQKVAEQNNCAFVETSAKDDINVSEVFELCLQEIEKRAAPNQSEPAARGCTLM
ncbi:ras-domain-containing protein, partial [Coprinopsis marcescibilis]